MGNGLLGARRTTEFFVVDAYSVAILWIIAEIIRQNSNEFTCSRAIMERITKKWVQDAIVILIPVIPYERTKRGFYTGIRYSILSSDVGVKSLCDIA